MDEIAVGKLTDIADGDYRVFALDKIEVGIFRTGSKVLAYENVCPHAGGPVCQGKIFHQVEEIITPDKKSAGLRFGKQRHIVCPWHGYEFDLATGCHPGDPRCGSRRCRSPFATARFTSACRADLKPALRKPAYISLSIRSASFSATMMVGILVLPRGMVGMIEASMTRKPAMP